MFDHMNNLDFQMKKIKGPNGSSHDRKIIFIVIGENDLKQTSIKISIKKKKILNIEKFQLFQQKYIFESSNYYSVSCWVTFVVKDIQPFF